MDSLRAALLQIEQALGMGDGARAQTLLADVLRAWPHCLHAHRLLGDAYFLARRYPEAISAYEHVLRSDPEQVDALYGLGAAHQALGHTAAVINAWEQALQIDPQLAERRARVRPTLPLLHANRTKRGEQVTLARDYLRGGLFPKAIHALRAQVKAQPARTDLRVALLEALWRMERKADAERMCYDLLALQPQLLKPTLVLAYLLIEREEPGGVALWQRAQRQDLFLGVAQTLFHALPDVAPPAPEAPLSVASDAPAAGDAALLLQLLQTDLPTADEQIDTSFTAASTSNGSVAGAGSVLDTMLAQADAAPANHVLQLAVARLSWQSDTARALHLYGRLIHDGALLQNVIDDLHEYADASNDIGTRQQIFRLLGDAYMRQHRVADAQAAYRRAFRTRSTPQPAG